jgi:2-dehydropantoate 2-reductase
LNWLIFGAGAIGTYIGSRLITHGQNVVFIERSQVVSLLRQQGLKMNFHGQEQRILHPDVYNSIPEVLALGTFDIAVFALKSYDTASALASVRTYETNFPPILCFQNGVENEAVIGQVLGKDKVIAGTITSSVGRRGAGDIILERQRGIGIADVHPLSKSIHQVFIQAGMNAHLYATPSGMKWSKMLTNLLANASSAILDMTPVDILRNFALYKVEISQLREALTIMRTLHIPLVNLPGTPVRLFAWAVEQLHPALSQPLIAQIAGRGRGQKMPSFHIDLHSGRQNSEVDYLNGAVVRFGELLNITTPVNRWLNQTLLKLTKDLLPINEYAQQPDKFITDLNKKSEEYSTHPS